MACMNMYNTEHQNSLMGPRISFSSDFVIDSTGPSIKHERATREHIDPSAPNFEFTSADNHSMIAADELFFKGRLLPVKEQRMTLREELLAGDEEEEGGSGGGVYLSVSRSLKTPIRWKGLLGLKKACPLPKRQEKVDGSLGMEVVDINAKASQEQSR